MNRMLERFIFCRFTEEGFLVQFRNEKQYLFHVIDRAGDGINCDRFTVGDSFWCGAIHTADAGCCAAGKLVSLTGTIFERLVVPLTGRHWFSNFQCWVIWTGCLIWTNWRFSAGFLAFGELDRRDDSILRPKGSFSSSSESAGLNLDPAHWHDLAEIFLPNEMGSRICHWISSLCCS